MIGDENSTRKIASLLRRLSSPSDGEVVATVRALLRTLEAVGSDIHALADRIEKPNGNGFDDAKATKIWTAAYAQGVQDTENRQHGSDDFLGTDGKPTWQAVALLLQRNKERLGPRCHEFIDKMAALTAWGRTRTDRASAQIHAQPVFPDWRQAHMTAQINATTVRQFLEIINAHAEQAINGAGPPGVLQLCRIDPNDESSVVPSRFQIGDVDHMLAAALGDAGAGFNVYIEARTVQTNVRGKKRGKLKDTAWVFGFVIDSDADKGKAGQVVAEPTLVTETSPGNSQLWYLLMQAIPAAQAGPIGAAIRVITQCYRVAGTPNFPSSRKRARGRVNVEPTRIVEYSGRLWDPDELMAAFTPPAAAGAQQASAEGAAQVSAQAFPSGSPDEATLPDDLLEIIRHGAAPGADRSEVFHRVIADLERRHWTPDAIAELLECYPDGIGEKYRGRVRQEVERSYGKVAAGGATPAAGTGGVPTGGPVPGAGAGGGAAPHYVIPTIRLVSGKLPEIATQIANALIAKGAPVFARGETLVEPVCEMTTAADGRKTVTARLRPLSVDSLLWPIADAAIFQSFNRKRNAWVDVDPRCSSCAWCWRVSGNGSSPG